MKNLNYFKIIVSAVFAFLFYEQSPGLNVLLFAVILLMGLHAVRKKGSRHPGVVYALFFLSAVSVFIYGNTLSIFSCLLVFTFLAGKMIFPLLPLSFTALPGLVNIFSAFPARLVSIFSRKSNGNASPSNGEKAILRLLKILTIGLVLSVFFILYYHSSAGFSLLVDSVHIKTPEFDFWFLLLMGAFISHAIYHHAGRKIFRKTIPARPETIDEEHYRSNPAGISWLSAATILFTTLNLLAVAVLLSDLYFIVTGTLGHRDPAFYSRMVHEGVWALVFSLVLALATLFVFFEGRINFLKGNKEARQLACLWIICNLLLVLMTAYKNWEYINELGMTYKRIGVWYYLAASAIGLCFMFIKIRQHKNFLYMIRRAVFIYVLLLVISSLVPWEIAVTRFNIRQAERKRIMPDMNYLLSLDGNNRHLLRDYARRHFPPGTYSYNSPDFEVLAKDYELKKSRKQFPGMVLIELLSLREIHSGDNDK